MLTDRELYDMLLESAGNFFKNGGISSIKNSAAKFRAAGIKADIHTDGQISDTEKRKKAEWFAGQIITMEDIKLYNNPLALKSIMFFFEAAERDFR